jgi:hypothetical protein
MPHWQRVVYVMSALVSILVLIVILTQLVAPVMDIAETHNLGPFKPAYETIKTISFWLLVPIFGLSTFAYLVMGPAQEELQKEKRRRKL